MIKTNAYAALLREGIVKNFPTMFREAAGHLKHPYLDPAGPYGKQLWDWDSFFASTALFGMLKDPVIGPDMRKFRNAVVRHAQGSLANFLENQTPTGIIPTLMLPDNADAFKCGIKNQGFETNMAKPVLGQFMKLLVDETGDLALARKYFGRLLRFYQCYEKHYMDKPSGLYVWGSDVAVGMDDDPTVWARPYFSSANLLLNCLLYADLTSAAQVARRLNKNAAQKKLTAQAAALKAAVRKYCWDKRDSFYYTVDVQCKKKIVFGFIHKNLEPFWHVLPLKVMVWTGFLPLWAGISTPEQARIMVKQHLLNPKRFHSPHGVRSLSKDEVMYQPEVARGNPSNWLGPIWIVSNYLVWQGLKKYGMTKEANDLAARVVALLGRDLQKNGTLHEYYSPETGKGVTNPNFWNWNNLAIFMVK